MKPALLFPILAIGWMAITGSFTLPNLILGLLVAALALLLFRDRIGGVPVLSRVGRGLGLALFFVWELLLSALAVARLVLSPNLAGRLKPAIIAYPLKLESDAEITLLANLITLTPGTLSVDVSDDRQRLFIHVLSLDSRDRLIGQIAAGFERRVAEVFR